MFNLASRYGHHQAGFEFFGDASSKARKTNTATTDYLEIVNTDMLKDIEVRIPSSNPPVHDRLAATNALICSRQQQRRLLVHPRCKNLIKDLKGRAYKPYTRQVSDKHDQGHITDALGYVVYRCYPITLPPLKPAEVYIGA